MSRIRSADTKPEILVRKFLHSNGFRFRLHYKKLPGRPDIVLPKYKTAIFIHGCFWHGHSHCKYARVPETNRSYWLPKIKLNIERDEQNIKDIKHKGWKIVVVWECTLKPKPIGQTLSELSQKLK